jgi:transcriptional regulator with XRE-family HTH domain
MPTRRVRRIPLIDIRQAVEIGLVQEGISVYRLAKRTGLDQGHLSRFLHGTSQLSLPALQRVAAVLHIELVV